MFKMTWKRDAHTATSVESDDADIIVILTIVATIAANSTNGWAQVQTFWLHHRGCSFYWNWGGQLI